MTIHVNGLDAVVFDLDGTLIDTAPGLQRVVNRMLAGGGLSELDLDTVKYSIGGPVEEMVTADVTAAGGSFDGRTLTDWVESYLAELAKHDVRDDRPFAGVPDILADLRNAGMRLAVCTNKRLDSTRKILEAQGLLGLFDLIVAEDQLDGFRKPDPRHLFAVLDGLGVPLEQAVLIGDHANDFNCARAAGVPVVLCRYGYSPIPLETLGPDAIIEHFTELPAALERIIAP